MNLKDVYQQNQRRAQAAQGAGAPGGQPPPPTAPAAPSPGGQAPPAPAPIQAPPPGAPGATRPPITLPTHNSGAPGGIAGSYSGREMSPLEKRIQDSIGGMLQNPTGYSQEQQQQMRNRAADPMAAQQQQNAESIREDAVRRGAASSEADIRDQMNRSNMEGAKAQSDASFDVDKALADLARTGTMSGIGAGNQLTGMQLGDVANQREMQMMLKQLQAQSGPFSGLGMAINAGG